MAEYSYTGRTQSGRRASGKITAKSEAEARAMLRLMGTSVTTFGGDNVVKDFGFLKIKASGGFVLSLGKKGVSQGDIAVFTKQLSVMIDAGVSIMNGLDILANQQPNPTMREALTKIREGIESGHDLASSMEKQKHVFDPLYTSLIRAGQASGQLDVMMKRLSIYIEKASKLRKQLVSALSYPAIIVVIAIVMTAAMLLFVVPMFAANYADSGRKLPGLTQAVIDMSDLLKGYFHYGVAIIVVAAMAGKKYKQTPRGQRQFDQMMLKLPIFGSLVQKISIARFSSTMATLIASGISIIEALEVCAKASGNKVIEEEIMKVRAAVQQGKGIAAPMAQSPLFPPMVYSMVSIGEASGRLDQMLEKVASFYEDDVDAAMAAALKMIEPAMFVIIGGIVGVILIAMYLPVFDMANNQTDGPG